MEEPNYLILDQYRQLSSYDDEVGRRYHFPKKYFNQLTAPNSGFIYFEPKKRGRGEYFGYGEIGTVAPDSSNPDRFFAEIINYRPFSKPVPGVSESGLARETGPYYNRQNAVRRTTPDIFTAICAEGGVDLAELGIESEVAESDEPILDPFDPTKIKVDREPMSVFQVLRKIELEEIVVHPEFQRNVVWDPIRRSRLIESALLRIPLPAFYFDGIQANRWSVVDGLQRLSTLRDFITYKSFSLVGMEYLTSVEGKRFDQLPRGMQRDLEETQVTLFIIRPETPPEVKFTIFYRINTGGLVLTAQEIRHALFQGPATVLLEELSKSKEFVNATDYGVSATRMDDRECILRYLAFHIHPYTDYRKADLNSFLSASMKDINAMSQNEIGELRTSFYDAMNRSRQVFSRRAFRKFTEPFGRRGPINKALFESWPNVLQAYDLSALIDRRDLIIERTAMLFASDIEYVKSLSAGTGSTKSVKTRFEKAHQLIADCLK